MKKKTLKKKTLLRSIVFTFLCCMMILGFQTNVKAETGNYYLKVNKGTNVVTVYTHDDKHLYVQPDMQRR